MAATTGADAISAAASRSASFRMIITKRFSTDLAKNQRAHSFSSSVLLCCLSEGLLAFALGTYLQPQFESLLGLLAIADRRGLNWRATDQGDRAFLVKYPWR
jgi:hypothetical protein